MDVESLALHLLELGNNIEREEHNTFHDIFTSQA
jgi:hypothetical protein